MLTIIKDFVKSYPFFQVRPPACFNQKKESCISYQAGTLTPKLPLDQTLHHASQTFPTMDLLEQIESVVC